MQAIGDSCTPPKEHRAGAQLQRSPELLEPEEVNYETMFEMLPSASLTTTAGAEITTMDFTAMDNSTISGTDGAVKKLEVDDCLQSEAIETAAIELLEELSCDEEQERLRLERKVENCILTAEKTFYEMGKALAQLRDRRLYRSTHKNFGSYCNERFHAISRRKAEYLIVASKIVEELKTANNCSQFLPTAESQVRALSSLAPEKRPIAWQQAIEEAGGKVPGARLVKSIVERLKDKPLLLASDFCNINDVFTLTKLEGTERKYNGWPCVAVGLKHFTIEVDVSDQTFAVKPENLKKIDSPDVRRQLPDILKRIKRVRDVGLLDRGAYSVLEHLGRQTYLTDLEADLLTFLEQRYGVSAEQD